MKEYKTNEELINLLVSKGVIVKNKNDAIKKIEKYTYYNVINSYKHIFKDRNNNYKSNVSFNEIYALYNFDKKLRYIMLKYVLEIETVIKSLIANTLSNRYGLKNYLNIDNLDNNAKTKVKENIIEKINGEIRHNYKSHSAITHYIDKYNYIPPFILIKILSFGVTSSLYGLLKQNDRQQVSKYFKISDKLLKQILKNLTSVRNICAHNERLYCFRDKYTINFKVIDKNYKSKDNTTNFYMIANILKLVLDKKDYKEMISQIKKEIKYLRTKLNSIDVDNVLRVMGYPSV
ncbi:MAG: Abi family protein [Bacilli bacterium]|nr:Abi family protein [Bacilli bacterium]